MSENNKIDVEACLGLLKELRRGFTEDAKQYAVLGDQNKEPSYMEQAMSAKRGEALLSALISALPGMAKDSDENADLHRENGQLRIALAKAQISVLDRDLSADLDVMQQSGKHPGAASVPNIEDFESRESIHEASAMPLDDQQYSRLLSGALGTPREEGDLPMMLALADECETWGNMKWATRLREIALNGESFESFQARRAAISAPPSPAVPNIEDGGCDICDDPNCYRNRP